MLRAYWESIWNLEKMLKYETLKKSQQNNINFLKNFFYNSKVDVLILGTNLSILLISRDRN